MKTKEQINRAMELFAVTTGNFQYSNPDRLFGGGRVVPNPTFIKQLQVLFKEILPTTEEIKELAATEALGSTLEETKHFATDIDDRYSGFIQGAEYIVKSITE
jgi:hypothetical protein